MKNKIQPIKKTVQLNLELELKKIYSATVEYNKYGDSDEYYEDEPIVLPSACIDMRIKVTGAYSGYFIIRAYYKKKDINLSLNDSDLRMDLNTIQENILLKKIKETLIDEIVTALANETKRIEQEKNAWEKKQQKKLSKQTELNKLKQSPDVQRYLELSKNDY